MDVSEAFQDVLQNIEFAVVEVWRSNPTVNNYTVMRAYDALIEEYKAVARQQPPKPASVTGLDAQVYNAAREICEWRLGHTAKPDLKEKITPTSVEDLLSCLRRLRKSVDFWQRERGRSGYLEYIQEFLP